MTLSGTATDPEDGSLDAGLSWSSDLDGTLGSGASIDVVLSSGFHSVTARVQDSGGLTGSAGVSIEVEIDVVPSVAILSPEDRSRFAAGSPVTLAGTATDPEEGDLSTELIWSSDRDGPLAVGAGATVDLSLGTHRLSAEVTDTAGGVGEAVAEVAMVVPIGPASLVSPVAAGSNFGCALDRADGVHCWGGPPAIGDGTIQTRFAPVPVSVPVGTRFVLVVTGAVHSCAIDTSGTAWCWGSDDDGQIGDGAPADQSPRLVPTEVAGGLVFAKISASSNPARGSTCGIDSGGSAYCWGENTFGALGTGDFDPRFAPAPVQGGRTWIDIGTGGNHSCGIDSTGAAWCWGLRNGGLLGDGGTTSGTETTPVAVVGGHTFTSLTVADGLTCALEVDGSPWCWGPLSGAADRATPAVVPGAGSYVQISTSPTHTCAIEDDGRALCWGSNSDGQLGIGSQDFERTEPTEVSGGHEFVHISAGRNHTCAMDRLGAVFCWGSQSDGGLGDGIADATGSVYEPVRAERPF